MGSSRHLFSGPAADRRRVGFSFGVMLARIALSGIWMGLSASASRRLGDHIFGLFLSFLLELDQWRWRKCGAQHRPVKPQLRSTQ